MLSLVVPYLLHVSTADVDLFAAIVKYFVKLSFTAKSFTKFFGLS